MIVTRIRNRLGDQLLKYLAARSLANHLRTYVVVDLHWNRSDPDKYPYYLRRMGFNPVEAYDVKLLMDKASSFSYNNTFFKKPDDIILGGLWYHHKYFDSIIEDVRKEVRIMDGVPKDVTGIHIRRGDFVTIKNRVECSIDYIANAIETFPDDSYVVTTDDYRWCRENLRPLNKKFYIYSTNPVDDFLRLRSCSRLIISASAFSYCAALIANCPTVAPDKWLHSRKSKRELPKDWIRI
jgi:hypothetical protein